METFRGPAGYQHLALSRDGDDVGCQASVTSSVASAAMDAPVEEHESIVNLAPTDPPTFKFSVCQRLCCRDRLACQRIRVAFCGSPEVCGTWEDSCPSICNCSDERKLSQSGTTFDEFGNPLSRRGGCCCVDGASCCGFEYGTLTTHDEDDPDAFRSRGACCWCGPSCNKIKCCGHRPFACLGFRNRWRSFLWTKIQTDVFCCRRHVHGEQWALFMNILAPLLFALLVLPLVLGAVQSAYLKKSLAWTLWFDGLSALQFVLQILMIAAGCISYILIPIGKWLRSVFWIDDAQEWAQQTEETRSQEAKEEARQRQIIAELEASRIVGTLPTSQTLSLPLPQLQDGIPTSGPPEVPAALTDGLA